MLFKINFAQVTAIRLHEGINLVRDLTFIKSVATFLADQTQRLRQRGILEDVAFSRCAPFAIERVSFEKSARKSFIYARTERPVIRDEIGYGKAFLGIMNRWREIIA